MKTMNSLIIGEGEVGNSLYNVLAKNYPDTEITGRHTEGEAVDKLHICIPYDENFESEVNRYQALHKPQYTIIHSSVPLGTCRRLNAIHHPVVGIHPHLEKSFLTFTQFLGGKDSSWVADYFRRAGMKVYLFDNPETTELGKFSQTTFYALMIEYIKMLKTECNEKNLSFTEVYTMMALAYNEGYEKLGYPEYKMPLLTPIMKKQGGHCTLNNLPFWKNEFTDLIKKRNGIV